MTIRTVVAVYDSATQAYTTPFFVSRSPEAIRLFIDEVNRIPAPGQPPNNLNAHASDFELHMLGLFNDETGQFDNALQSIARAKDHLRPAPDFKAALNSTFN